MKPFPLAVAIWLALLPSCDSPDDGSPPSDLAAGGGLDALAARQMAAGELDESNLVLMVRDRAYLEFVNGQEDNADLPTRPLIADLSVLVAEHTPRYTRILSTATLEQAGLTFDSAYDRAEKNLSAKAGKIRVRGRKPLFTVGIGEDLDASLLVLPKVWDRLQGEVSGDLVVVAAARDTVIFTGAEEPDGIDGLRALLDEITATGHDLISDTVLVWRDGRWAEFDAPARPPK